VAWTCTGDLAEFFSAVGELAHDRQAQNAIALGAREALRSRGSPVPGEVAPLFGWWRPAAGGGSGATWSAFLHTPPLPIRLTALPGDSGRLLAELLAASGRTVTGVNAAEPAASEFAVAWTGVTGAVATTRQRSRLFELGVLVPPEPSPAGVARIAGQADRELLISWFTAFGAEVGEQAGDAAASVDGRLGFGGLTLWEVSGSAVSLAGISRPASGVVQVGPVYTPPSCRGRGYAGAVTAAVSQAALDAGAQQVALVTDLANPTSNALYQRLGYAPAEDRALLTFEP
jgi:predicted GNAT family acetyltransferase